MEIPHVRDGSDTIGSKRLGAGFPESRYSARSGREVCRPPAAPPLAFRGAGRAVRRLGCGLPRFSRRPPRPGLVRTRVVSVNRRKRWEHQRHVVNRHERWENQRHLVLVLHDSTQPCPQSALPCPIHTPTPTPSPVPPPGARPPPRHSRCRHGPRVSGHWPIIQSRRGGCDCCCCHRS